MFEAFVKNIVQTVKANPDVWDSTAIFITTDESGGLYDSGYIQTIDFFGDCPRIMLLLVSPYAKQGYVDHTKWRSRFVVEVPRKKTRALVPFRRQAAITFPIL